MWQHNAQAPNGPIQMRHNICKISIERHHITAQVGYRTDKFFSSTQQRPTRYCLNVFPNIGQSICYFNTARTAFYTKTITLDAYIVGIYVLYIRYLDNFCCYYSNSICCFCSKSIQIFNVHFASTPYREITGRHKNKLLSLTFK